MHERHGRSQLGSLMLRIAATGTAYTHPFTSVTFYISDVKKSEFSAKNRPCLCNLLEYMQLSELTEGPSRQVTYNCIVFHLLILLLSMICRYKHTDTFNVSLRIGLTDMSRTNGTNEDVLHPDGC